MPLSTTLHQIKRTLLPVPGRVFDEARLRHPALSGYESPLAVLAALDRRSTLSPEARDAIVIAILAELQAETDPLWQRLLLAAFEPMLVALRWRAGGRPDDEDLDGAIVLSFLEVARAVRACAYATRSLRLATEATVLAEQRDERRARGMLPFDEEAHAGVALDVDPRASAEAREVARIVEAEGGDELRRVLVATYAGDESLRTYVNRRYASSSATDRASTYDRLCRARLRVVAKLRGQRQRLGAIAA